MNLRHATASDIEAVYAMIASYAEAGALLARSRDSLRKSLPDLVVADEAGEVIGVAALHLLESGVGEVRSLAVADRHQKRGIGQALVLKTVAMAEERGLRKVICFTRQVAFFERCGFYTVQRETLPVKYLVDCIHCPFLDHCDETAMERVLGPA